MLQRAENRDTTLTGWFKTNALYQDGVVTVIIPFIRTSLTRWSGTKAVTVGSKTLAMFGSFKLRRV